MSPQEIPNTENLEPIFILGAPRSGTTFLASLLRSTRFGTPVETQFIVKYFYKLNNYGNLNELHNYKKLVDDILKERAVMQWRLNVDILEMHKQLSIEGGFNYGLLINKLLLYRTGKSGKTTWGDKTPSYIADIQVIDEIFPNAKYIYIIRDGRDVALSLIERKWGPNNIYTASELWTKLNCDSPVISKLRRSGQLFDIRYEDLVINVEKNTSQVMSFLDESISNEKIQDLAKTVRSSSRFRWKKTMSKKDIQVFESLSAKTLDRLGYETNGEPIRTPSIKRHYYIMHDRISWLVFMAKTNLIDGIKIKYFGKEPFAE